MVVRERDVVARERLGRSAAAVEAVRAVRVQEVPVDDEVVDVGEVVEDADGSGAAPRWAVGAFDGVVDDP
jgi:hypothetical protein